MKVSIVYNPNSEQARPVEEFVHEFKRIHGQDVELISTETREGADIASLYDITRQPTVVVRQDNGQMVQYWTGEPLPLMSEVAAFLVG
jgi:hypothetical protein